MRKKYHIKSSFLYTLFFFFFTILCGCKMEDQGITVYNNCDCVPPLFTSGNGYRLPSKYYRSQTVSLSNKKLFFSINDATGSVHILDLTSLAITIIPLKKILPDTANWGQSFCSYGFWCPYDDNKLIIQCTGYFDTTGLRKSFTEYRQNIYIVDITLQTAYRVTPSGFGKYGSKDGIGIISWLKGSTPNLDSLNIGYGIYVPQEEQLYPLPAGYSEIITQSKNTSDVLIYDYTGGGSYTLYLNGLKLGLSKYISDIEYVSWSSKGSKLALSVSSHIPSQNPLDPTDYEEIWIVDAQKTTNIHDEVYRLNFPQLFCKYSFNGIHAEYITDSTLAVSMHKDGDNISPLWEITDKGRIVRQLTK